jgi:hypothetical protein
MRTASGPGSLVCAPALIGRVAPSPQPNVSPENCPSRRLVATPTQRRQRLCRRLIDPRDALVIRLRTGLTRSSRALPGFDESNVMGRRIPEPRKV